jgi:thiosulfate/3-mercaptopyruvate sulfurtransferase
VSDKKQRHPRFIGSIFFGTLLALCILPMANAQTSSPREALLVTANWLKQHADDKDLVLLHAGEKGEYDSGHIPGARFVGMETFGAPNAPDDLILELPEPEVLHQQLEALGVSDTSRIVVYHGRGVPYATRVILTLDAAGLGDRVALLDGGLGAWQRGVNATTTDAPAIAKGKLAALQMKPRVVDADFVRQHLQSPGYKVIDARAPVFYDGVQAGMGQAPANLKGHLPGAQNIPFSSVTTTGLSLKSPEQLADLFKTAGVEKGDRVIAYCHIGAQATAVVFAARTLGIDAVLYDGSFQDWARRGLPVESPLAP